jgi:hypothetical protein
MSNFTGVIVEESLQDKSLLQEVKILQTIVEKVTRDHQTPWLSKWTLHRVEISEKMIDDFNQKISRALESERTAWYADFHNQKIHYVIFPNKIFAVDLQESKPDYKPVKEYGLQLGIPDYQLDFTA